LEEVTRDARKFEEAAETASRALEEEKRKAEYEKT